jgi:Xaa-Pro aminopeptidase
LSDHNLAGRIQVTGLADAGEAYDDLRRLERRLPGLTIVGFDRKESPILRARATKDRQEVERIRRMGEITLEVVGRVAEFLTSHTVKDGLLTDRAGRRLTVGDVKRRIDLWLMQLGAENPEGTIFAIGAEAGVPHNAGSPDQPIPAGRPIIFDIFPAEAGGGYFYDFTRTWCLGHAPEAVAAAHADVVEAYAVAMRRARAGSNGPDVQKAVCEFFEARGHPTVLTDPAARQGYLHAIGHGLGLEVHERPGFRLSGEPPETLEVGHVITIEPGLYYPERGFGVRVEDTVWIGPDGPQVLGSYPFDLVLPLRRSARASTRKAPPAKAAKGRPAQRPRRAG